MNKAYVEHVAIYVTDIDWYVNFFNDTLNMTVRMKKDIPGDARQIWLYGGIQLIEVDENQNIGKLAHLGIMAEDQQETTEKIRKYNVRNMPQGDNWFELPDGLCLEILQAKDGAVSEVLNVSPW